MTRVCRRPFLGEHSREGAICPLIKSKAFIYAEPTEYGLGPPEVGEGSSELFLGAHRKDAGQRCSLWPSKVQRAQEGQHFGFLLGPHRPWLWTCKKPSQRTGAAPWLPFL